MTALASPSYVIVTPARDEAGRVEQTIASVVRQTLRPLQWVLVDDGSNDGTPTILDEAAHQHPWITVVHLARRDRRGLLVAAEIAAFHAGWQHVAVVPWDFAVKLDADLVLPSDYFQRCFHAFARDPRLGIAGGTLYHVEDARMSLELGARFHVRGATKIYRRACWDAIGGGPPSALGWDALDELKAQMLGWATRTLPEVRALHLRRTGEADGVWPTAVKDGRANYMAGYHPLFMLLKATRRLLRRPYIVHGLGLCWGYFAASLHRSRPDIDPELVRFVRRHQIKRLLGLPTFWR